MNEKRVIKEWKEKAPSWDQIVEHYRNRPGHIEWLANRHPVMRGEIDDTPEPTVEALNQDVA
jgi:hypothetical protein